MTAANSTVYASDIAGALTWTAGDILRGVGTGNTFSVSTANAIASVPTGATVSGFQTINIIDSSTVTLNASAFTGLTALNVTAAGALSVTAAATTSISETDTAQSNSAIVLNGGLNDTITTTQTLANGGVATGGTITVGGTTATNPAGTVTVNQTIASSVGATTGGAITVTGGTVVAVNVTETNSASGAAGPTTGLVTVIGGAATTSVSVSESAPVVAGAAVTASAGARNASAATNGIANGSATIADANAASSTVANTLTTVNLNNLTGATTISSTALNTLGLNGFIANTGGVAAVATTEGGSTATVAANKTLTINTGTGAISTTGSSTVGALSDASNQYSAMNIVTSGNYYVVNANANANNIVSIQDTALRTLNVSGTGLIGFTNAGPTTANRNQPNFTPTLANANGINTAITAVTVTGGASLLGDLSAMLGLSTVTTATTGTVTVTINGAVTAFTGGAGRTVLELTAQDATKTINLGSNSANQLVLSATGSTYQGTGLVTTTNVTGYTQLGVADSTAGATYAYTVSSFASTINTLEVYGMAGTTTNNFTGVAAGTALVIDNATTQVSYTLASSASGPSSTVNVTMNGIAPASGTGTIGYTTGTLVLQDANSFGVGTVNLALDASVGGGVYAISTLTDPNLATLNVTGTGALQVGNTLSLNTIGTVTINDNDTSTATSSFNAITGNNVTNLAFTGTKAVTVTTLTDTIPVLTISNVNTGTTGVATVTMADTSTLAGLTLTGSVIFTATDTIATAVTVAAGTDNSVITLSLTGGGAHTVTMGNGANVYVGGAGVDTLTFGTGAVTVTAGAGADRITVAAHTGTDTFIVNAVSGTSSDSGIVTVAGNGNDTGADIITGFNPLTDVIRVVNVGPLTTYVHGTNSVIGTAGAVDDGTFGSFTTSTGLIDLTGNNLTIGTGDIAITFASPGATLTAANFNAALQYDITGAAGGNSAVFTGGARADTFRATTQTGTAFDTWTGGAGADTFFFGTRANAINAAVAGNTTAAFFDKITDFVVGTDVIKFGTGAAAFATGVTFTAATVVNVNTVTALGDATYANFAALAAAVETARTGVASSAATVQAYVVTTGAITTATGFSNKTYLVINDATLTIAETDTWIDITGVNTTTLTAGSFAFGAS